MKAKYVIAASVCTLLLLVLLQGAGMRYAVPFRMDGGQTLLCAACAKAREREEAQAFLSHLLGETSFQLATISSISPGFPDPESGNLMYQISADDRCVQTCDLKHVRCNPAPEEGLLGPMLLRYDHPMELEFEVLP